MSGISVPPQVAEQQKREALRRAAYQQMLFNVAGECFCRAVAPSVESGVAVDLEAVAERSVEAAMVFVERLKAEENSAKR